MTRRALKEKPNSTAITLRVQKHLKYQNAIQGFVQ